MYFAGDRLALRTLERLVVHSAVGMPLWPQFAHLGALTSLELTGAWRQAADSFISLPPGLLRLTLPMKLGYFHGGWDGSLQEIPGLRSLCAVCQWAHNEWAGDDDDLMGAYGPSTEFELNIGPLGSEIAYDTLTPCLERLSIDLTQGKPNTEPVLLAGAPALRMLRRLTISHFSAEYGHEIHGSFLEGCSQLTCLEITHARLPSMPRQLSQLISRMEGLRELALEGCSGVDSLALLAGLTSLSRLSRRSCNLAALPPHELGGLTALQVSGCVHALHGRACVQRKCLHGCPPGEAGTRI